MNFLPPAYRRKRSARVLISTQVESIFVHGYQVRGEKFCSVYLSIYLSSIHPIHPLHPLHTPPSQPTPPSPPSPSNPSHPFIPYIPPFTPSISFLPFLHPSILPISPFHPIQPIHPIQHIHPIQFICASIHLFIYPSKMFLIRKI